MEPIRFITRHKSRNVKFYESECTDIDPESKTISITGNVAFSFFTESDAWRTAYIGRYQPEDRCSNL